MRHLVTLQLYIYDNESDSEAIQQALNMAKNERKQQDNYCKVIDVYNHTDKTPVKVYDHLESNK